jgi:hypothetical protein
MTRDATPRPETGVNSIVSERRSNPLLPLILLLFPPAFVDGVIEFSILLLFEGLVNVLDFIEDSFNSEVGRDRLFLLLLLRSIQAECCLSNLRMRFLADPG